MSTLNNKLDYLDETKQLIKQAIIDKGQEVSDEDTFRSYVDKISDIETGNDTKDATATSNDILYPETAYISNGKVTGNIMPTYSSNTTLSQTNTISRSLSYSLLDINYDAKIAIVSDEDYKFNFCNIANNEIDYENSAHITLNDFEEGMDGTYSFSRCCTNFDKNTNDLYLYLLFTFQNTFKVFCYIYNIKTKSSKYIDTYELTIDDANNSLVLNMMIRPNYPNQVIVFCGYTSTTALGSYLTTVFLQFNTVALELQKIEDTISTSSNQYAAKVESCYFTSNGEYLCINVRTGTLSGTTQNGVIYHCVNNFLESIVDSTQYVTLFENGNYMAYNQSTRNHCLFNVNGDVLHSYSGNLGEVSIEQLTYTNKCILGNYLFGFAYPEDFINPTEPFILYCCKLNEDYTITKEYEINVGSRTLFNCYNAILYDNKTTRNFDGYLGDTEKEIISLERNNTIYFSTKDSDATKNDVLQGKIFYNSEGKQIGNKIFTDYNDSVGILETNAATSVTAVDQLIGVEMTILPDIEYLDKVKVNDIVKVIITIIDVATSSTTLKCNCLAQILEIIDLSDKQFKANVRILAADVNTEDGTATSEDIVEGKTAYVNNERVHGTAKLGIDTSDADATSEDILAPKTAYVNGKKIEGIINVDWQEGSFIVPVLKTKSTSGKYILDYLPTENVVLYQTSMSAQTTMYIGILNDDGSVEQKFSITKDQLISMKSPTYAPTNIFSAAISKLPIQDRIYNICITGQSSNHDNRPYYVIRLNLDTWELYEDDTYSKCIYANMDDSWGAQPDMGYHIIASNTNPVIFMTYPTFPRTSGLVLGWQRLAKLTANSVTLSLTTSNALGNQDNLRWGIFSEDGTYLFMSRSNNTSEGLFNVSNLSKSNTPSGMGCFLRNGDTNYIVVGNRTLRDMSNNQLADWSLYISSDFYYLFGHQNILYVYYNHKVDVYKVDFMDYSLDLLRSVNCNTSRLYNKTTYDRFIQAPYSINDKIYSGYYGTTINEISLNELDKLPNTISTDSYITYRIRNEYDAKTTDILYGKKAVNKYGETVGTMPNNEAKIITPGESNITIPAGYHNGSGYVKAVDITSLNDYKLCDAIADSILEGTVYKVTSGLAYNLETFNTFSNSSTLVNTGVSQNVLQNDYTIFITILPYSWGNYKGVIGDHAGYNLGIVGLQYEDGNISWFKPGETNPTLDFSNYIKNINNTYDIVITRQDGRLSGWCNKTLVGTNLASTSIVPTGNILIGRAFNSRDRYFDGKIGYCYIYNRCLSDSEIKIMQQYIQSLKEV